MEKRSSDLWPLLTIAIATRAFAVVAVFPGFPPGWGGEMVAVAKSIASGHGFASPYLGQTGPTALMPPVYPYILSGLFRLFGPRAVPAAIVALGLNVVASALVLLPLFDLAERLWNERVAVATVWIWALLPLSGYTDASLLWNTALYTLALTTFLALTVQADAEWTRRRWALYGGLTSLLIVIEPVSLTVVGAAFLWMLARRVPFRRLALSGALAVVLPGGWAVRNVIVFHRPVFIRSGFGLELSSGVREYELSGRTKSSLPNRDPEEFEKYRTMGELSYVHSRLVEAVDWIRTHPAEYRLRVIHRAIAYWAGYQTEDLYLFYGRFGSIKRCFFALPAVGAFVALVFADRRYRWLVLGVLAWYPLVYYITHTEARMRMPIEPLLVCLTVGAAVAIGERVRGWSGAAVRLGALTR